VIDRAFVILLRFSVILIYSLAGIYLLTHSVMTGQIGPLFAILQVCAGFAVGRVIGVAAHECGHVLAAAAMALPVRLISLGKGPLLSQGRFGETAVLLRLYVWAGGCTLLYPPLTVQRSQYVIFLIGGILGNATLALLAVWLLRDSAIPENFQYLLGGAALAQVIMIISNLIPRTANIEEDIIGSDGRLLLKAVRDPWPNPTLAGRIFAARLQTYGDGKAVPLPVSPVSARLCYQLRRERWVDEATRCDVDGALLRELRREDLTREQELLVLDALMTDALLFRDPALQRNRARQPRCGAGGTRALRRSKAAAGAPHAGRLDARSYSQPRISCPRRTCAWEFFGSDAAGHGGPATLRW
jgi:Peptidase family M50